MDTNLIIQYILVGITLGAVIIWCILKIRKARKRGIKSSCCGCALSESCSKSKATDCDEQAGAEKRK